MSEEIRLIQPAKVVRDEMGSFQHPDIPDFDEGDGDKCKAWVAEQGLTVEPAEDQQHAPLSITAAQPTCQSLRAQGLSNPRLFSHRLIVLALQARNQKLKNKLQVKMPLIQLGQLDPRPWKDVRQAQREWLLPL
jgi:hypothetical protein